MNYSVNPSVFLNGSFPIPSIIADKYLKLATEIQLKVILCVLRNCANPLSAEELSKLLSLPLSEVEDALVFWAQREILNVENITAQKEKEKTVVKSEKPSREDVAKRGLEDPKIMMMLQAAQLKFGRNLKTNETRTLVWLYDDKGMSVSLILMLLEYAAANGKLNLSFIEKTAASWIDLGIETISDAEAQIERDAKRNIAANHIYRLFGIDRRKPSEKEMELSSLWLDDWELSDSLISEAYNRCIDKNAKISFAYIGKILESWHKKGYKTAAEIKENELKPQIDKKNDFAAYDIKAFEKMLDDE